MDKRKGLFIMIVLLWLPLFAAAQQNICDRVVNFAQKKWTRVLTDCRQYAYKSSPLNRGNTSCFVVVRTDKNLGDTLPGYMLVAARKEGEILLAYDDNSKFMGANLPPHIKSWIGDYEQMCSDDDGKGTEICNWMKASRSNFDDVPPLLGNIEWGQDSPYNLYCPAIDGIHCPSGCVATALSQIMCYHRWPHTGTGNITYTTATNKLEVSYDFDKTVFDWDSMQETYLPFNDLSSQSDAIVIDGNYSFSSIVIDGNSTPNLKCYINISDLVVMGTSFFEGEVALIITDDEGNYVSRGSSSVNVLTRSSGRLFSDKSLFLSVPSMLPDGNYRIYCAARSNGVSRWSLCVSRKGENYITFLKDGNGFTAGGDVYPCSLSEENVRPVATLLQAVGAAVKMDYDLGGSGSYDTDARDGIVSYFNYDSDMFIAKPNVYSDKQWHELLQLELLEGRPVYYSGQGVNSGHAFVIDGFQKREDGTTYYHVNWGWDGLCNGYYLLNMLRPSSAGTGGTSGSNYANSPNMFIGMKPEDGESHLKMNCGSLDLLDDEFMAGDFLPICIRTLALQTNKDFSGKLRLELQNEDHEQDLTTIYESNCTVTNKRGLVNYFASSQVPIDVKGGTYLLKIDCTTDDGEDVEIHCEKWPQIRIRDIGEWTGGPISQPLKKLAVGGLQEVQVSEGTVMLSVDSIVNPLAQSTFGRLALVICDDNGVMLQYPSEMTSVNVSGFAIKRDVPVYLPISRNMPDGNYELRIGYLPQDESLWTFCDRIYCEGDIWWAAYKDNIIPMSIMDGRVAIPNVGEFYGVDIPWETKTNKIAKDRSHVDVVYDLFGCRVTSKREGIYVIRKNNQFVKIIKQKGLE